MPASTEATWLTVTGGNATYGTPAGLEYNVDDKAITCASRAVNEEFVPNGYAFKITDTNGHCAFQDGNGYTLANNTDDYSNLTRVYEVTLPESVTTAGTGVIISSNDAYYVVALLQPQHLSIRDGR